MTVNDIIPQHAQDALAQAHQRLIRLATLDSARMTEALTWLSGYSPSTFDATLDATEPCTDDDTPDLANDPEPFCTVCGADLGISCDSAWAGGITAAVPRPAPSNSSTLATPRSWPGAQRQLLRSQRPVSRHDRHAIGRAGPQDHVRPVVSLQRFSQGVRVG